MIDPKTYWNRAKTKGTVAELELHLRPLSVAVSIERLPGDCTLYRIDWLHGRNQATSATEKDRRK